MFDDSEILTYYDSEAGCSVTVENGGWYVSLTWDDPTAPPEAEGFDGVDETMMRKEDFSEQINSRFTKVES